VNAEVLVVGLGPAGLAVSALLGQAGVDVVGVEAAAGPHGDPRAAALDEAALGVLDGLGVAFPRLDAPEVLFVRADGREVALDAGRLALFHQPALEAALLARAGAVADLRFGARLAGLAQDGAGVTARLADGGTLRARWLLGADGARSTVRGLAGIRFAGATAPRPWLVVDAEVPRPLEPRPRVRFVGDPRRPAVTLPLSPRHHRWELALAPGEADADVPLPPAAREVRRAVYVHHARRAQRWRAGRVLLLGDAAHVMPPFAGQGLAQGLRDVASLAPRLAAVLRAGAPEAVLDGYEAERGRAVAAATRLALAWGALLQVRRPRLVRARDGALRAGASVPGLAAWVRERAVE